MNMNSANKPIATDLPIKKTKQTRPRKIIVPQGQKLLEMFTTDIDRIQMYIDSSPFADRMDAAVIREINHHAVKMSMDDFQDYLADIGFTKSSMVTFFQNAIDNDSRIHKIHRTIVSSTKDIKEEDAVYIISWKATNHSNFRYIHLGEHEPYQYEYDEDDLSINSEYEYDEDDFSINSEYEYILNHGTSFALGHTNIGSHRPPLL